MKPLFLILFSLVKVLTTFSVSVLADSPWSNCVDACIVEFMRLEQSEVTAESLRSAVSACGLDFDMNDRTLEDCRQILAKLGKECELVEFTNKTASGLTGPAIVYRASKYKELPGHVVLISPVSVNRYRVFDPGRSADKIEVVTMKANAGYRSLAIISKDSLFTMRIRQSLYYFAILLGSSGMVWGLRKLAGHWRTGSRSAAQMTIVMIGILTLGCQSRTDLEVDAPLLDLGEIEVTPATTRQRALFTLQNFRPVDATLKSVARSCHCVTVSSEAGLVVPSRGTVEFVVEVDVTRKFGGFEEIVLLDFNDRRIPLTVTGFARHPPTPSFKQLEFEVTSDAEITRLMEFKAFPGSGSIPKLLDAKIEDAGRATHFRVISNQAVVLGTDSQRQVITHLTLGYNPPEWPEEQAVAGANLICRWSCGTVSTVALCARTVPPVELLSTREFVGPFSSLRAISARLPVRINNPGLAARVTMESSSPHLNASLDIDQAELVCQLAAECRTIKELTVKLWLESSLLGELQLDCR